MPMYEYRCSACDHKFERRQKYSDPLVDECPKCGGKVKKLISSSAFSLKGDGWFNQGYCSKTNAPKPVCCPAGGCCGS